MYDFFFKKRDRIGRNYKNITITLNHWHIRSFHNVSQFAKTQNAKKGHDEITKKNHSSSVWYGSQNLHKSAIHLAWGRVSDATKYSATIWHIRLRAVNILIINNWTLIGFTISWFLLLKDAARSWVSSRRRTFNLNLLLAFRHSFCSSHFSFEPILKLFYGLLQELESMIHESNIFLSTQFLGNNSRH